MSDLDKENLRVEYSEVCQNFRLLTDIRFKLLALLPIGAGAGVSITSGTSSVSGPPIGLFGFSVTLALLAYNARNDQLYGELIGRAAYLERRLGLLDGYFAHRPGTWLRIYGRPIEHGWPISLIYGVSLVAWLYIILLPMLQNIVRLLTLPSPWDSYVESLVSNPWRLHALAIAAAMAVISGAFYAARRAKKSRERQMRKAAALAVNKLKELHINPPDNNDVRKWKEFFRDVYDLAAARKTKNQARILTKAKFYISHPDRAAYYDTLQQGQYCDEWIAAQIVGLLTDQPPRWVLDTWSGRSGQIDIEELKKEGGKKKPRQKQQQNIKAMKEWLREVIRLHQDRSVRIRK